MRIKIKELPNNKIEIKLKNNLDKNLIVSAIATFVYLFLGCLIYIVEFYSHSEYEILRKANQFYEKENYLMAAKYYEKAFKMDKNIGKNAYSNYGITLSKLSDFDSAIEYLKKSQESEPENVDKLYDLAYTVYLKAKENSDKERYLEAAQYLETSIFLDRNREAAYILAGVCYRNAGNYEKAVSLYKKALSIKSFQQTSFYNLIGDTFAEISDIKEALNYYNLAVAADNSFILSYINLGDIYRSISEYQMSLANYKKAVQINPGLIDLYVKIGVLYLDMGKYYEAEQSFLQGLKTNSNNADIFYNLGITYMKMGRKKDAGEYFKKAVYLGDNRAADALKEMNIDLG